ncbi:hypothetical protein M3J09_009988 [Ascochyta lentis]
MFVDESVLCLAADRRKTRWTSDTLPYCNLGFFVYSGPFTYQWDTFGSYDRVSNALNLCEGRPRCPEVLSQVWLRLSWQITTE